MSPSSPPAIEPSLIARAAQILRAGGLVAFPTETVYGLGANALDPAAVARIFTAKGRPSYNPLIVHVADVPAARALAAEWTELAQRLADAFWPGPLTLIIRRAPGIADAVSAGLPTVALRIPAHPVALALLEAAGRPVAAPSANRSTEISPTTAEHVRKGLGGHVDLILDGGPTAVGIESTVLDVSGPGPVLLRPGTLRPADLEAVAGPLLHPVAAPTAGTARPSPGMMDRHYAPRAEVRLLSHEALTRQLADAFIHRSTVGALVLQASAEGADHPLRMPGDAAEYAARLYAALHALDDAECDLILVEEVPDGPEWSGVRDRLRRAAHPG